MPGRLVVPHQLSSVLMQNAFACDASGKIENNSWYSKCQALKTGLDGVPGLLLNAPDSWWQACELVLLLLACFSGTMV